MRLRASVVAALVTASLASAPAVLADDPPKADGAKAGAPAEGKSETTTRVDRAKQVVKELEDAVAKARAAQPVDAQLLLLLTTALDQARALAKPARPEELTADEKKAVVEEAKAKGGDAGGKGKDPMQEWADKRLAAAFEGVDLSEEDQIKAKKIIGDWWSEWQSAFASSDSKKLSDIKRKRDDDLEKAVGPKKGHKITNNLDAMKPGRR
jgi:hypothetical protein